MLLLMLAYAIGINYPYFAYAIGTNCSYFAYAIGMIFSYFAYAIGINCSYFAYAIGNLLPCNYTIPKGGQTLVPGKPPTHHSLLFWLWAGQQYIVIYNLKNVNIATASAISCTSACLSRFASLIYSFVSH